MMSHDFEDDMNLIDLTELYNNVLWENNDMMTTIGTWVRPHLCLPRIIVKKCENILNE